MAPSRRKKDTLRDAQDIPLSLPDFMSHPKSKTLVDIINERNGTTSSSFQSQSMEPRIIELNTDDEEEILNNPNIRATKIPKPNAHNGSTHDSDNDDNDDNANDTIPPLATAILHTTSLAALHTTLDLIVLMQYSQPYDARTLASHTLRILPALLCAMYVLALPVMNAARFRAVRQTTFCAVAVACGCYLLWAGNEEGYYAVMKRAPALGTVWVWSVVEMDLVWAFVSMAFVGGYAWLNGYSEF